MTTEGESKTIMGGLASEIERCAKLKAAYDGIPNGAFGAMMIQQVIDKAKAALASGDLIEMILALKACERCE